MVGTTGFFSSTVSQPVLHSSKRTLVDLGGAGDCGFRAIVAGVIENILSHPNQNDTLAKKLVDLHAQHFPTSSRQRKASEQIKEYMQQPFPLRFLIDMAYALRQSGVDEVVANPERYRAAFVAKHENTNPASMRRSETWIDESLIAAVSSVLDIPIRVNVVDREGELPLRLDYGVEKAGSTANLVVIQLKNDHYKAELLRPEHFARMNATSLNLVRSEPLSVNKPADPSLTEILQRIEASDRQILSEFEKTRHRLEVMVATDEMTKDDLMTLYINGMGTSDYLEGRVKYIGLEHGTQDFFETLQRVRGGVSTSHTSEKSSEAAVIAELIHALARAISIGQIDLNLVDDDRPTASI